MGFFDDITNSIGDLMGAKEEVTNQIEEVQQNIQDANPLDALTGEGNEGNKEQ